jgi:hypothetical protein
MKALSVLQPWAELLVLGHKRYEFRSWKTVHRGPLLIHASSRFPESARRLCQIKAIRERLADGGIAYPSDLHLGTILGAVVLEDCMPAEQVLFERPDELEQMLGDFRPGQWAWKMSCPVRLPRPLPFPGRLGLFEVPL